MTNQPEILALIARHLEYPNDLECKAQVDQFRKQSAENEAFYHSVEKVWHLSGQASPLANLDDKQVAERFEKKLNKQQQILPKKQVKLSRSTVFFRWAAAAVILLALGSLIYLYSGGSKSLFHKQRSYASDALPGSNKAILVLADGRKISLSDVNNGNVAKEAGLSITKTADGQLVYNVLEEISSGATKDDTYNTIETPKGGVWQIKLPDGSSVWLNAASSLTYPISFAKGKNRIVELKGEAYFEVSKDKEHPFIVKTAKQEVEVLGTHFNINSYADESEVKTTLLEGSVKVVPYLAGEQANVLKPGEQSILNAKGINIKEVDADEAIDWKNGYFMFNNERQESIMRKIARWYNVQIEYADASAKDVMYYGSISRFENVSKLLRKFEQTGEVRFEINKNKITVYKETER
ncbi:FecR domain-containing protein [Pedobacter sp.]|uniref:FecR family protein n=1 Tax=Pedobacter sp. TaxID=1411316 RepID=UPI0031CEAF36